MKVSIIGHCGSGKTTLAKNVHTVYSLPILQLDTLWFKHSVTQTKTEETKQATREYVKQDVTDFLQQHDSWVIDGIQWNVQPLIATAADQIIFIDIALPRRLYNHLKRWLLNKDRHNEVTWLEDFLFIFTMVRRTVQTTPKINAIIKNYPQKVTVVSNYTEIEKYILLLKK